MCKQTPCARDIAASIENPETVLDATAHLQSLSGEEFDQDCVRVLIDRTVSTLGIKNRYHRRKGWEALEGLADGYPASTVEALPKILEAVPPDSNSQKLQHLGTVVATLLEHKLDLTESVDRAYAESFREVDSKRARSAAIDLFEQHGSYQDFVKLEDTAEYEMTSLSERASRAADDVLTRALNHFLDTDRTDTGSNEQYKIIRHVAYNDPLRFRGYEETLFELLGTDQSDVAILSLTELISETETDDLASELVSVIQIDEETFGSDTTEIENPVPLRRAEDALSALTRADETGRCLEYLLSHTDEWLESEAVQIHEHALRQLRILAEQAPETLDEYINKIAKEAESGGADSSLAAEVLTRYVRARTSDAESYLEEVLEPHQSGSAVAYLANSVNCLQYQPTGEVSYQSLSIDDSTERALKTVAEAVDANVTLPTIWPSYHPQAAILVALELVLRGYEDGRDVVLFSAGGGKHWGNKGDLRDELANYGIEISADSGAIPLPEIVSHARIDDGSIKEMSDGDAPNRLVLSKRLNEVAELPEFDVLVLNLTARTKEEFEDQIDDFTDEQDSPVLPLYTNYTKHEFEERRAPRYGPPKDLGDTDTLPGLDALEAAAREGQATDEFPGRFAPWFQRATAPGNIRVVAVDDAGLLDYLDRGYEASSELREYDENRAAGRIFSRQLMFERLPVPTNRYDEWVRGQRDGYFGPRTTSSLIDKLEEQGQDVIGRAGVATELFDTADALREARAHIGDENQLYEELCRRLEEDLSEERDVALFLPKETWRRAVREIMKTDGVVTGTDISRGDVRFVSPDSARDLKGRDRLYIVGPQRPQYAGYYLHPGADETVVLTYGDNWSWMIERDAERFVGALNTACSGVDYEPYDDPVVETEMLFEPTEQGEPERAPDVDVAPSSPPAAREDASSTAADQQESPPETKSSREEGRTRRELGEFFDQARTVDYESGGSGRYDDGERREFVIETGGEDTLVRRDRVLRYRPSPAPDEERYHWVSPRSLREGDEIAIIDDDVYERRWNQWLDNIYDDEYGDTHTFDDLATWRDSLTEILQRIADEVGADYLEHRKVRLRVMDRTDGTDRKPATVWRWFTSAVSADSELDMARDPSLTIGPRRADDIHAIGEEYEISALTDDNALRIEESMSRIRGTNTKQGHEFRKKIKDEMNSLESDELREHAHRVEVESVTER